MREQTANHSDVLAVECQQQQQQQLSESFKHQYSDRQDKSKSLTEGWLLCRERRGREEDESEFSRRG